MLISSLVVYNSNENVSNLVETFNSIFKESIKLFDNDNYTNDLAIDDSLKYRKIIDSLAKFSFVLREIEGISENDVIDKSKIPQSVLDYFDDIIAHNDLNYKVDAPSVKIDDCLIQLGYGGLHGAKETTFIYDRGDALRCK